MSGATCPLCAEQRAAPWRVAGDQRLGGPALYHLARCLGCGLIRQEPPPDAATLAAAYGPDYAPHAPPARPAAPGFPRRLRLVAHLGYTLPLVGPAWAARPLRWAGRLLPAGGWTPAWQGGGTLLDVGCGSGGYLLAMQALGWQVRGVEPSAQAVAQAQAAGLDVFEGTLEAAPLAPASADVITLWHVLEHLPDPVGTLRRARELLRPGGRLLLEVPNAASGQAACFGRHWFHLDQPRHLTLQSPQTLRALLEAAGFEVVALSTHADPKGLVASSANLLATRRGHLASAATRSRPALLALATPLAWVEAGLGRGPLLRAEARPRQTH